MFECFGIFHVRWLYYGTMGVVRMYIYICFFRLYFGTGILRWKTHFTIFEFCKTKSFGCDRFIIGYKCMHIQYTFTYTIYKYTIHTCIFQAYSEIIWFIASWTWCFGDIPFPIFFPYSIIRIEFSIKSFILFSYSVFCSFLFFFAFSGWESAVLVPNTFSHLSFILITGKNQFNAYCVWAMNMVLIILVIYVCIHVYLRLLMIKMQKMKFQN